METLHRIDEQLFLALNFDGGPFWDGFFAFVSGKVEWTPLYLLILWLLYRRQGWKGMLLILGFAVLAVAAADQAANFFKHNMPRLRPGHTPSLEGMVHLVDGRRGGNYGTVSAHAATVFSVITATIPLVRSHIYTALIITWGLLVCYSRIYLGMHFPLDILFGIMLGVSAGALCLWGYRKTSNALKL